MFHLGPDPPAAFVVSGGLVWVVLAYPRLVWRRDGYCLSRSTLIHVHAYSLVTTSVTSCKFYYAGHVPIDVS